MTDLRLIEESWALATEHPKFGYVFYDALFELRPEYRTTFFAHTDMQRQRKIAHESFDIIIRNLRNREVLEQTVREIAVQHRQYHVRRDHMHPMGAALIQTLRNILGDGLTPQCERAWVNLWHELSDMMAQTLEHEVAAGDPPLVERRETSGAAQARTTRDGIANRSPSLQEELSYDEGGGYDYDDSMDDRSDAVQSQQDDYRVPLVSTLRDRDIVPVRLPPFLEPVAVNEDHAQSDIFAPSDGVIVAQSMEDEAVVVRAFPTQPQSLASTIERYTGELVRAEGRVGDYVRVRLMRFVVLCDFVHHWLLSWFRSGVQHGNSRDRKLNPRLQPRENATLQAVFCEMRLFCLCVIPYTTARSVFDIPPDARSALIDVFDKWTPVLAALGATTSADGDSLFGSTSIHTSVAQNDSVPDDVMEVLMSLTNEVSGFDGISDLKRSDAAASGSLDTRLQVLDLLLPASFSLDSVTTVESSGKLLQSIELAMPLTANASRSDGIPDIWRRRTSRRYLLTIATAVVLVCQLGLLIAPIVLAESSTTAGLTVAALVLTIVVLAMLAKSSMGNDLHGAPEDPSWQVFFNRISLGQELASARGKFGDDRSASNAVAFSLANATPHSLADSTALHAHGPVDTYTLRDALAARKELGYLDEVSSTLGAVVYISLPDEAMQLLDRDGVEFPIEMLDAVLIPLHGTVLWAPTAHHDETIIAASRRGILDPSDVSPQTLGATAEPQPEDGSATNDSDAEHFIPRAPMFTSAVSVVVLTSHVGNILHITESIRAVFPDVSPVELVGEPLSSILALGSWVDGDSKICRRVSEVKPPPDCKHRLAAPLSLRGAVVTPLLGLLRWGRRRAADQDGRTPPGDLSSLPMAYPRMAGLGQDDGPPFIGTAISFAAYHQGETALNSLAWASKHAAQDRGENGQQQQPNPLQGPTRTTAASEHSTHFALAVKRAVDQWNELQTAEPVPVTLREIAPPSSRTDARTTLVGTGPMDEASALAYSAITNGGKHLLRHAIVWTQQNSGAPHSADGRGKGRRGQTGDGSALPDYIADLLANLQEMDFNTALVAAPATDANLAAHSASNSNMMARVAGGSRSVTNFGGSTRKSVKIDAPRGAGRSASHVVGELRRSTNAPPLQTMSNPGASANVDPDALRRCYTAFVTKLRIALFAKLCEVEWCKRASEQKQRDDSKLDETVARSIDAQDKSVPVLAFVPIELGPEDMERVARHFNHAFVCMMVPHVHMGAGAPLTARPPIHMMGPTGPNIVYVSMPMSSFVLMDLLSRATQYLDEITSMSQFGFGFDPSQEGFWLVNSPSLNLGLPAPPLIEVSTTSTAQGAATASSPAKHNTSVLHDSPEARLHENIASTVRRGGADMRRLGSGAFSVVYHVSVRENNVASEFAMKRIVLYKPEDRAEWQHGTEAQHREALRRQRTSEFETECHAFLALDHPNLCRTFFANEYATDDSQHRLDIYMEYCDGGTLATLTRADAPTPDLIFDVARQVLRGLHHLHKRNICHLDIKPENIMIRDGTFKIADFGTTRRVRLGESHLSGIELGTRNYMAPEIIINEQVSESADIFSFGVMLAQMLGLIPEHLLGDGVYDTVITRIRAIFDDRQAYPPTYSSRLFFNTQDPREVERSMSKERTESMRAVLELLKHCLCVVPDERLPASRLLELDVLKDRHLFCAHAASIMDAAAGVNERTKRRAVTSTALSFNSAYPVNDGGERGSVLKRGKPRAAMFAEHPEAEEDEEDQPGPAEEDKEDQPAPKAVVTDEPLAAQVPSPLVEQVPGYLPFSIPGLGSAPEPERQNVAEQEDVAGFQPFAIPVSANAFAGLSAAAGPGELSHAVAPTAGLLGGTTSFKPLERP